MMPSTDPSPHPQASPPVAAENGEVPGHRSVHEHARSVSVAEDDLPELVHESALLFLSRRALEELEDLLATDPEDLGPGMANRKRYDVNPHAAHEHLDDTLNI